MMAKVFLILFFNLACGAISIFLIWQSFNALERPPKLFKLLGCILLILAFTMWCIAWYSPVLINWSLIFQNFQEFGLVHITGVPK
jgi:hypothetical protein